MYKQNKIPTYVFCRRMMLILVFTGIIPVHAANLPDPQELIQQLGIGQEELANLQQGQAVSFDVAEDTEKELAAGVVMFLPATPAKVIEFVRKGDLASIDTDVVAHGIIARGAPVDALKDFGFTAKQSDEAANFLAAEADDFNLSAEEIETLKAVPSGDAKAAREAASQAYRNILLQRWEAYRKNGLQGIATYSRDGDAADPAAELRDATENSKVLARYFPDLYNAWLNYPSALPAGAEEYFFWLNRKVEKRPTAILGHRVILTADNGAVIVSRQFYVGHSYNSSQLSIGCLPYRDGALVFYASRTSTDQVAGMGSSLKHSIGREQMRAEIVKRLKKIRQLL
jgi:hypothetical protein